MTPAAWRHEGGGAERVTPDEALAPGADLAWIHLEGTGPDVAAWLEHSAGLDPIVAAALTAAETRPRCDAIGDGALVNLRGLAADPAQAADSLASIRLFATRGRVISVSRTPLSATALADEAMAAGRLADPGDLVTALAVAITRLLDPEVAALGDSLDACEVALDARESWRFRRSVGAARRRAIDYRRFVHPERDALERLADLDCDWLDDRDRQHLREAADRFARMAEELESIRERAALMHDQLTDMRAELIENRSLLLAIVALIFLPLTFLTGLLGMNVGGIPWADEPWAFWAVVGLCAGIAALLSVYFVLAHWLRR